MKNELDPNDYEIESVHTNIMVPGTASGTTWEARLFDFAVLETGQLLVVEREARAGYPQEVVLLSNGTYAAKMKRKEITSGEKTKRK